MPHPHRHAPAHPSRLPGDPLAVSAGAGSRLVLAVGVLVVVWACVAWAMAA